MAKAEIDLNILNSSTSYILRILNFRFSWEEIISTINPITMLKSRSLENPNQRIILEILWVKFFHKTLRLTTHELE